MRHILVFFTTLFLFTYSCKLTPSLSSKSNHERYELISPISSYYATYRNEQHVTLDIKEQPGHSDSIVAVLYTPLVDSPYESSVFLEGIIKDNELMLCNETYSVSLEGVVKDTIITSIYKDKRSDSNEHIVWSKRDSGSSNGDFIITSKLGFYQEFSLTGHKRKGLEPCTGKYIVLSDDRLNENQCFTIVFQYPSLGFFQGIGSCGMGIEMLLAFIKIDKNQEIEMQFVELLSCNNGTECRINNKIATFETLKELWNKNRKIALEINDLRKDEIVLVEIDRDSENPFRKIK